MTLEKTLTTCNNSVILGGADAHKDLCNHVERNFRKNKIQVICLAQFAEDVPPIVKETFSNSTLLIRTLKSCRKHYSTKSIQEGETSGEK